MHFYISRRCLLISLQNMKTLVAQLKGERERLNVEINKRDSTTTGKLYDFSSVQDVYG